MKSSPLRQSEAEGGVGIQHLGYSPSCWWLLPDLRRSLILIADMVGLAVNQYFIICLMLRMNLAQCIKIITMLHSNYYLGADKKLLKRYLVLNSGASNPWMKCIRDIVGNFIHLTACTLHNQNQLEKIGVGGGVLFMLGEAKFVNRIAKHS